MRSKASSLLVSVVYLAIKFGRAYENLTYVYVLPTTLPQNEATQVPCATTECHTLQELSTVYRFTSNTTLVLLPGVHEINQNTSLDVENVRNFEIVGYRCADSNFTEDQKDDLPTIQCSNSYEFIINLRRITGLVLCGLKLNGCSGLGQVPIPFSRDFEQQRMTIYINASSEIQIKNVYIYNSTGVGLWMSKVYNEVAIESSEFSHNERNLQLQISDTILKVVHNPRITNDGPYIQISITNTVFDMSRRMHGVEIYNYHTSSKHWYQVDINNVTLRNNIDTKGMLTVTSWSSQKIKSILNIKGLTLVSMKNSSLARLEQHINQVNCDASEDYGGLHIESYGKLWVNISDSSFRGPGSSVKVVNTNKDESDWFQTLRLIIHFKVYFYNTVFEDVVSQCGYLNIKNGQHVEIHDIVTTGCSQPFRILHSNVTLYEKCSFQQNSGTFKLTKKSTLFVAEYGNISFENNDCSASSMYCPILEAESSYIVLFQHTTIHFRNNSGTSTLVLHQSNLVILGNTSIVFDGNTGKNGGALSLYSKSMVEICTGSFYDTYCYDCQNFVDSMFYRIIIDFPLPTSNGCKSQSKFLWFVNNNASGKGGALFIDDSSYYSPLPGLEESQLDAFNVTFESTTFYYTDTLKLHFVNNTADIAGTAIYGGWLVYKFLNFTKTFKFNTKQGDLSVVSSNPVRVCLCELLVPNCNITDHQVETYPGRTINLSVVAVGQGYGTVPSIVHAELKNIHQKNLLITLNEGEYIQEVEKHCTSLRYTFFLLNQTENASLKLTVEKVSTPDLNRLFKKVEYNPVLQTEIAILKEDLTITVVFKDCPLGFIFNHTLKKCSCHPILFRYQIYNCNIESLKILKPSQKWINATFEHNLELDTGLIVSNHCPFDYCKQNLSNNNIISISLEHPDDQCNLNRSGILCGGCQSNFSHILGTSKCAKCSNVWSLLLIPAFAIVGLLLIVFALALNLTVSTGMLNSLILYANIIRADHTTFNSPSFLSYFIAWLNLDLGIETCFYDGLDAYAKTWFQFIFPLYVWTIMIILILLSRRYVIVTRLCGSNVVQVLATLFLLSYAKLIRIIITIFQSTILVYPDGYERWVWLYDGNVDYLKGKHIPLFIAGLFVLICLSFPYTMCLLFIQLLRKYNHYRILRWVGKLKPLFDAYTGPFKEKHVYWFGVLLLVRVALYLVFSLNISGNSSLNLMAIGTTTMIILSYLVLTGGVYESTLANVADVSFMLNLGILTMGAHFYNNPQKMSTVSVAIAFSQFVLIVLYHLYIRTIETRKGKQLNERLTLWIKRFFMSQKLLKSYFVTPTQTRSRISHSSIELKEPLLVDVTTPTFK